MTAVAGTMAGIFRHRLATPTMALEASYRDVAADLIPSIFSRHHGGSPRAVYLVFEGRRSKSFDSRIQGHFFGEVSMLAPSLLRLTMAAIRMRVISSGVTDAFRRLTANFKYGWLFAEHRYLLPRAAGRDYRLLSSDEIPGCLRQVGREDLMMVITISFSRQMSALCRQKSHDEFISSISEFHQRRKSNAGYRGQVSAIRAFRQDGASSTSRSFRGNRIITAFSRGGGHLSATSRGSRYRLHADSTASPVNMS